jgi:hypothetical protein
MKRSILGHGTWLGIAAISFVAGHWLGSGPRRAAISQSHAGGPANVPAAPAVAGAMAGEKRVVAEKDDPTVWVRQFIGHDGRIPPEKMALALQEALRESDPVKSTMNFAHLMKHLTSENAPTAFKTLRETVTGFEALRFMPMLSYEWGSIDGASALAAMKDIGGRDTMIASAATLAGWASADPAAARKWLDENGTAETRWLLNRALITGMATNDPEGAARYVSTLDENERGNLVDVLAEQRLKSGLDEATRWALGLEDATMKMNALDRVAEQFTRQDPVKAAEWIKAYAGESYARDAVGTVAQEFAQKDPDQALAWAGKLPAGETQSEAYGRLFREWGRSDPTGASESLNRLPPGASKDQAINSFSRSIARENPEDAITWAATIQDPQVRENTQIEVVQRWRMTNATAATEWAAANLSPEAQQKSAEGPHWDRRGGGIGPMGGGRGFPGDLLRMIGR